jgi:hypothetical protein
MPVLSVQGAGVTAKGQWDYLITTLRAETGAGRRLVGVNYVGKAYQLWTENPPAIGVQLKRTIKDRLSTGRRLMRSLFWIIIGVQSTPTSAAANMGANAPPNLEDAMKILEPYVGDASGNGIIPILDDQANYNLGGYAMTTLSGDVEYDWEIKPGKAPQIWAYAHITFTAEAEVLI